MRTQCKDLYCRLFCLLCRLCADFFSSAARMHCLHKIQIFKFHKPQQSKSCCRHQKQVSFSLVLQRMEPGFFEAETHKILAGVFRQKSLNSIAHCFQWNFLKALELKRHFVFSQNKKAPAAKTSERFLYQKNHFQLTMANTAKTIISSLMAASKAFDTTFGCARTPFHRS